MLLRITAASPLERAIGFDLPELVLNQAMTDSQIGKIYREVLGRDSDLSGGPAYSSALASGTTLADIRSEIAHSAEAQALINSFYTQYLKRNAEPAGLENWTGALAAGHMTLDQIRTEFLTSVEGLMHTYDQ